MIKNKKEDYTLPPFDLDRLLNHIQDCVNKAPYGIVQLFIDLFCGCGGVSEGIENAKTENGEKCSVIIVGINHDIKAIYSQAKNHPLAYYSTEDIRVAKLGYIKQIVNICRQRWPQCPVIGWGSFDCTSHSGAKGGSSRDADSRTLAWHIYRYLSVLKPDGFWVENVKEFYEWGPLMEKVVMYNGTKKFILPEPIDKESEIEYYQKMVDEGWNAYCPLDKRKKVKKGQPVLPVRPVWIPIKSQKGIYYQDWKKKVKRYGYHNQEWLLNAADFGVPQNRKRFFPVFMRKDWPIIKPEPTHAKKSTSELKPYIPIKTCLDFSLEGESIFTPGKIKSKKSFERYYAGLMKHIAGGKENFMAQRNGGDPLSKVYSVEGPARAVITTGGNQELVSAFFIAQHNGQRSGVNPGHSIDNTHPTLTCKPTTRLVEAEFFITKYGSDCAKQVNPGHSVEEPSRTLCTMNHFFLTKAEYFIVNTGVSGSVQEQLSDYFIVNNMGKSTAMSIENESPSVTVNGSKICLAGVQYFIVNSYTSGGQTGSIENTSPAITTVPKSRLAEIEHFILNPAYKGCSSSIFDPSYTVVARQDKAPLYLVNLEKGWFGIPVFKTDSDIVIKIKEFMALYLIKDIKMRSLVVPELLKIQSFPENYFLAGTQTDRKKFIGNAVPPILAQKIAESMYSGLVKYIIKKFNLAA